MNAHISKPMDLNAIKKNGEDGESMKTIFLNEAWRNFI